MKNIIIVGVDGSATARKAADVAAHFAAQAGASLHVVTAYECEDAEVVGQGSDRWVVSEATDAEATSSEGAKLGVVRSSMRMGLAGTVIADSTSTPTSIDMLRCNVCIDVRASPGERTTADGTPWELNNAATSSEECWASQLSNGSASSPA